MNQLELKKESNKIRVNRTTDRRVSGSRHVFCEYPLYGRLTMFFSSRKVSSFGLIVWT